MVQSAAALPHHTQPCFGKERIGADKQEEQLSTTRDHIVLCSREVWTVGI
jgi:hypothetical protein